MKNNALENRRNLMLNVGLWNRRRNETQNYSEIDSTFAMPKVLRIPSHFLSLSAFQLVNFAQKS